MESWQIALGVCGIVLTAYQTYVNHRQLKLMDQQYKADAGRRKAAPPIPRWRAKWAPVIVMAVLCGLSWTPYIMSLSQPNFKSSNIEHYTVGESTKGPRGEIFLVGLAQRCRSFLEILGATVR
jgi:hypothetical protein